MLKLLRCKVLFLVLTLVGCSTTMSVAPAWTTVRLIERGTVTAEQVIETTERIQVLMAIDGTTLMHLGSVIRTQLGYEEMLSSDRMLLDAILSDIANSLEVDIELPVGPQHTARIRQILADIQLYAAGTS